MDSRWFAEAVDDACEDGLDPRWCLLCAARAEAARIADGKTREEPEHG